MRNFLLFLFLVIAAKAYAQPANDNIANAITLSDVTGFCSADAAFNNTNATASGFGKAASWGSAGKDVWFKFRAINYAVSVTAIGRVTPNSPNTLVNPLVAIYTYDPNFGVLNEGNGSMTAISNTTEAYRGALEIGKDYYIRVSAENDNTGSFKLCVNNYNPPVKAGQDCATASNLCSKQTITVKDISGRGNTQEGGGTCLGPETNSAWYTFTAANSGTLTFVITPTVESNDVDWALYDAGVNGTCASLSAIRCASGSGTNCPQRYFKTGMDLSSADQTETAGCVQGQDGFVRFVDLQPGHVYFLLVDNVSAGTGFTLEFGGTGTFVGPEAKMVLTRNNPCTPSQSYTFVSQSTGFDNLKWTFGDGASLASATTAGPFTITYSTPGEKIVVLEATNNKGCSTIAIETFFVGIKPATPVITINKTGFCLQDNIQLSTPVVAGATYQWTGPNNFTSAQSTVNILAADFSVEGTYSLTITVNGCTSDAATKQMSILTPKGSITVVKSQECTPQFAVTFSTDATGYTDLKWSFGTGASLSTATTAGPHTITYTTAGPKTVTLELKSAAGCVATLQQTFSVSFKPATPVITSNKPDFCIQDVIELSIPPVAGATYSWTGPNQFTADQPSVSIPVTGVNLSGNYSVVVKTGDCTSDAATVNIPPILKKPIAAFKADPQLPAKLAFPVKVNFSNESIDGDSYLWDFGDGSTSTEINPSHEYTARGDYTVTLTVFKSDVCSTVTSQGTFVVRDGALFIPNTFTPNGDGVNDEFVVTITNLRNYYIRIYNRWGNKLFESRTIFENWNGLFKNQHVPVGTYYYIIEAADLSGAIINRSGSVTIIR